MPSALEQIVHYIEMMLSDAGYNPHLDTLNHLTKIKEIAKDEFTKECTVPKTDDPAEEVSDGGTTPGPEPKIIFSCDASITKNPGGQASVGVVLTLPGKKPFGWSMRLPPSSDTNNKAEYDAIHEAMAMITQQQGTYAHLGIPIEIRSDSKLAIDQLNGKMGCNDDSLKKKRDCILEQQKIQEELIGVKITFHWYARNTTPELKQANYLAQAEIGVRKH